MRIQSTNNYRLDPTRFTLQFRAPQPTQAPLQRATNQTADLARQLLDFRERLGGLGSAAETLGLSVPTTRTARKPAVALSRDLMGSGTGGTASTLTTGGLVGAPTTLDGVVKSFAGPSTSQATFGGTYNGDLGPEVELLFEVHRGGILGNDRVEVDVLDEQGVRLERLRIRTNNPDEVFTLSTGLQVGFSPGELQVDDTFTLNVSTSGGVLDPDQVFQGSGLPGSGSYSSGFDLGSTAIATVGGAYTGAFNDTLRFEVSKAGVVGVDDVEITVFDGAGSEVGKLQFDKEFAIGTELTLDNGLAVSLSAGALLDPDQFEVDVTADDRVVFDGGLEVQAGTLSINGTAITVDALDTVRTLSDKITASAAGVIASFDPASGEFRLTASEVGPSSIDIGPDDTGFFAAIGLGAGNLTTGTDPAEGPITQLSEIEGLTSGNFSINGQNVEVNVATDSIDDLIATINGLDAGVRATLSGDNLRLTSSRSFNLQKGSSNFLESMELAEGQYKPTRRKVQGQRRGIENPGEMKQTLDKLKSSLKDVFSVRFESAELDPKARLLQAISDSFNVERNNPYYLNTGLGLRFQMQDTNDVLAIETNRLHSALSTKPGELGEFLLGRENDEGDLGLISRLSSTVDSLLKDLVGQLDPDRDGGLLLDLMA